MKRQLITVGLWLASWYASAQGVVDSVYKKRNLSQTEIQVLMPYYLQAGNHSAVTGGIGTEELSVYAPEIYISHQPDSARRVSVDAGVDIITSASTDNINYIRSSASRVDARWHGHVGYSKKVAGTQAWLGAQTGFSIESDYASLPLGITYAHQKKDGMREVKVGVQAFYDDLRWGRINPGYYRPTKLIYPSELRTQEWYSSYRRTSYNLTLAIYQVLNKRMQMALFPEVAYQYGLLSTPFHRVYFNDPARSLRVEKLQGRRLKIPLGIQLNWFITDRIIIRTYYRRYWDTFGIHSHTAQIEMPVKVTPFFTIAPLGRYYVQTAARDFKPYAQHDIQSDFYSSDYDLSAFRSYKLGLTLRYAPVRPMGKGYIWKSIDFRYSRYWRSDGLSAHTFSLLVDYMRVR